MKKGFTMIELIFVIVILGILAAVAVPRLTATRDDAEVAKAATNLTTLVSDISAYYTSQAEFAKTLTAMTNVQIEDANTAATDGEARTGNLQAASKTCLTVSLTPAVVADGTPAILAVTAAGTDQSICTKIHANKSVKDLIDAKFSYKKTDGTAVDNKPGIAISGLGVKF